MIPTVLLIGLVGGLLWPSRGRWVVAACSIGWVLLLLAGDVINTFRQILASGLVAALNAALAVIAAALIRHRLDRKTSVD